jgi:hypothetical protein
MTKTNSLFYIKISIVNRTAFELASKVINTFFSKYMIFCGELHAARRIFSKNLALFEKSTFLPVLGRFCMRALWRRFDWKMPIFCPRSQFLAGSSHAAAIFSKSARDSVLIMRFLDSWLHAASTGYRVDEVYRGISGIKSNNWVYFRQVCQVVW